MQHIRQTTENHNQNVDFFTWSKQTVEQLREQTMWSWRCCLLNKQCYNSSCCGLLTSLLSLQHHQSSRLCAEFGIIKQPNLGLLTQLMLSSLWMKPSVQVERRLRQDVEEDEAAQCLKHGIGEEEEDGRGLRIWRVCFYFVKVPAV